MKRIARAALFPMVLASLTAPAVFAATPEEARLLGSDREEAEFQSTLPFSRRLAASGVIEGSLAASATSAGVPAAAMTEALTALGAAIDLDRELREGDRFYIRYERTYTGEGNPVGVGRVLWAELRTAAKGTIAIHRFRPLKAASDGFWLSTGQAATAPALRLPLDSIAVSSGFGMRADPFDQPFRGGLAVAQKPATSPIGSFPAAGLPTVVKPLVPPKAMGGPPPAPSPLINPATIKPPQSVLALQMAPVNPGLAATKSAPRAPVLMMHEGVDLAASFGTPVRAAGDGLIKGAQLNGGYGNWIEIEHDAVPTPVLPGKPDGKPAQISTVYGHLSGFAAGIGPGTRVKQGDVIGYVGSTGRSTGPHLHFEIQQNGHPTNPMISQTLRPEQLKGGDLERFRKAVAQDLAERQREAGAI